MRAEPSTRSDLPDQPAWPLRMAYPAVRSGSSAWPGTPSVLSASDKKVSASRSRSSASRRVTAHGNPASAAARLPAPAAKNAAHSDSAGSTRGSSSQTLCGRFRRPEVAGLGPGRDHRGGGPERRQVSGHVTTACRALILGAR